MDQSFSCEGFKTEQGLIAVCSTTLLGFRTEEELATYVLSMKQLLQNASNEALKIALPNADTITTGKEEIEYGQPRN